MKNQEYVNNYFTEMKTIIQNLNKEDIDKVIEMLLEAWKRGNKVFI